MRQSGIRLLHRPAGFEPPTTSETVRTTLKGIRRSLGVAPKQKAPATVEVVLDMVQHVPERIGTMSGVSFGSDKEEGSIVTM